MGLGVLRRAGRKAKYDFDESAGKALFRTQQRAGERRFLRCEPALWADVQGAQRHSGLSARCARVFEVSDADGKPLALFYCDYFKRDNKNGGAWMDNLVGQSKLLGTLPVVYNVANFSKPAAGQPALLSFDDVTTMFHEFGHALHGMFADTEYPSLSGTSVARDFVEFPSQFNEHWASYPAVFDHYARHYKRANPCRRNWRPRSPRPNFQPGLRVD